MAACGALAWAATGASARYAAVGADRRPTRTIRRSTRSAPRCAPPTKPCRRRCRAIRPRLSLSASGSEQYLDNITRNTVTSPTTGKVTRSPIRTPPAPTSCRSTAAPITQTAPQRLSDRQPHPAGRAAGFGRARDAAADRADRAARRRHRLHEPDPRRRDPRSAAPQRRSAAGAVAPDPRPLQRRRGHAHRRRAGGIAAGRGRAPRC